MTTEALGPQARPKRTTRLLGTLQRALLSREWLPIVAVAAIGVFVLGTIGFMQTSPDDSLADAAYKSLQLFTVNSGAVPHRSLALEVARYLAPLVIAAGLLSFIRRLWFRHVMAFFIRGLYHRHIVVCGLGKKGSAIVSSALARNEQIVAIEKNKRLARVARWRKSGVIVLEGDATDEDVLRTADLCGARLLFAVTGEDATNVRVIRKASSLCSGGRARRPLLGVAHISTSWMRDLEAGQSFPEGFAAITFDAKDRAARTLIKRLQIFEGQIAAEADAPHVLVIGRTDLVRRLTLNAIYDWWESWGKKPAVQSRRPLRLTIIHPNASQEVACIRMESLADPACYELATCADDRAMEKREIERLTAAAHASGQPVTHAVVCCEADPHLCELAWSLVEGASRPAFRIHAVVAKRSLLDRFQRFVEARALSPSLVVHPLMEPALDYQELAYDYIARMIHQEYLEQEKAAGRTRETNPSLVPWEGLPEALRESSRRNWLDMENKLRHIGCRIRPLVPGEKTRFAFRPEEVEDLAKREHDRWMQERIKGGWRFGELKDTERKVSPCLLPWERLDEATREKDRYLVRMIPDILLRCGYDIDRRP